MTEIITFPQILSAKFFKRIAAAALLTLLLITVTKPAAAQSCNQIEILYQSPDCFEKRQGSAGNTSGSTCVETAVCVNQPYTYTSSVSGVGWTLNWNVTGPTAVVINPNTSSSVVNIVWPQTGVYTLTLTATDGAGNVYTYCLKVDVKAKPVANFTFTPNNVCEGSTISFTNTTTYSGGGVVYSWNFGDPSSGANNYSTATHPTHTFNTTGVYTVTLVASSMASSGGGGTQPDHGGIRSCCSDTITMQVTIIPGSLTIECISTVCAGDTATYTAVGCANPVWSPPVGGVFLNPPTGNTVTIVWGNGNPQGQIVAQCPGGCIATVPVPIIPANPVIVGNAIPCPNSTTSYSLPLLPGTFYNWTLNNISNATNYNSLLNTYPDNNTVWINWTLAPPGTYHLTINLVNKHLCCNSTGLLVINPSQPWQAFSDQTVCTGPPGASLFVLPGAGTFNWTVLPPNAGVTPLTGTGSTFNPVFSNTGNYTIEVIETGGSYCNSGSANPQQIQVTVVNTPLPGVINGPATVCLGSDNSYSMSTNAPNGYHYAWSISSGAGTFQPGSLTTATGNSATIQWTSVSGTISVALQRNGSPQCPNPVTLNVVQATVGVISGPLSVCVDGTASYTLTGGSLPSGEEITWSLAAPYSSMGTIISGQGTGNITILWHGQPGIGPWGPVTINASTGCGNATPLSGIMVYPKFLVSITQTGSDICQPGGVTLTVTGAPPGSTYLWNTGATTSFITNINTAGTYDVTVTKGGCSYINQYLVPDPFEIVPVACGLGYCNVNDSTNQMLGVAIVKPLIGTFTYQWYTDTFPTGTLIPGANTANYTAPYHGNYYVVVTYGTCSKHVSFEVSKVCCPDVNNPQITSVVRNTCNSYTFTGTTPNPYGAPITWYWGDGSQDSGVSGVAITHAYALAGEYCVTFCVGPPNPNTTNCSGNCVATNVTVPIDAAFTYTMGCNGCLNVSNTSTVITSNPAYVTYFWNFGDGNTSTSQNPGIHCYALPGNYTVTLAVTYNDGIVTCTKTATQVVNYTPLGIIVAPTPVCSGTPSTYSSTPGSYVSYTWDFGDGFTAYTASSIHIYNTPGTFLVTLTVIDQLGNTCSDTTSINVLPGIGPCSIQPAFMCPGGTAQLSTTFIAGYTWLWEVETSPNVFVAAPGVNTNNIYTVTVPGFYRVIITGTNGCSCITKKAEVKLVPSPKAIIAVAPSAAICGSGNITLTSVNHLAGYTSDWYANGNYGTLLSSGPAHFEFGVSTTTIYNLVLTNEYGCSDTCSFAVIVNPVPVPPVITSSPGLCEGVPNTLTVTNYSTGITWNSGNAGTTTIVTSAGTYTATYTDSITGCSSSSNITINRRPPVDLFPHYCDNIPCSCRSNALGDFTIYAPKPLIGTFASLYDIQWYFNNTPVGTNGPNPNFTPAVSGAYHIVVTDPITGCTDTSETYTVIVPLCNQCDSTTCHVDLGNDTTICAGGIVTLTANGCNGDVEWYQLTQNGPVPIGQGPIIDVNPLQTTCYAVQCCDSIPDEINGGMLLCCCTDTICINVNPLPVVTWPVVFPSVCINSDSIYLDTLSIIAIPTGGTGVFSGIGVTGNYFHPDSIGTFTITYCYTDPNGCTTCVSNTINVIFCCDSTSCHVDAGADQTICAGGVAILNATGCSGTAQWYKMTAVGNIPIGQGPIVDVLPTQNTCYMVICCCQGPTVTTLCCDTDIVCINVYPAPHLVWTQFPDVCVNSAPILLDTANIFVNINNVLVPVSQAGGTGVFSGPFVTGNIFTPSTIGSYTITYSYTDTNGCTGSVSATINVIFCCDSTSCHVDAGADQTICAGGVAILNAQGCNGTAVWYQITANGPVVVGQGEVLDVLPTQSTCYMVICCCQGPTVTTLCCDTDIVCVNVYPTPNLVWNAHFPTVCQGAAPILLDTANIFVNINNVLVPVSQAGGTGVFSGPFVTGNIFTPSTIGSYTITYSYTDTNGCTGSVSATINVIFCCDTCNVSAGPDQTICLGNAAILNVTGCNGPAIWTMITPEGPIVIGQGETIDVMPQQSTCYIVTCCVNNCCCSDTVCVTVRPRPVLQWPQHFDDVCLNGDSIYLNPMNVFVDINQTMVMLPFTGGTWTWSGPGVSGNYFHPTTLGPHTITLCYTDSFGCTTCITNTINVIFCCGESCQVNAGNDTTICVGSPFTLNAQGCNGNTTWYQLAGTEAIPIGFEPNITVNPQQNTCYMVICCCQGPIQCCDTDTICINVSQGLQPQWLISYVPICVNSVPLYLDESNIFVTINNQLVPITQLGGSGVFSGTNVSGNYFYPNATGVYTITYTYTDPNGCVSTTSINVTVINCGCGPCYKPGPELVVNPGFESGTVGFTSQLSNICNCLVGSYCVTTSAQLKCASHLNIPSTSLPTGNNYLVVDGHGSVARRIWQENITVLSTQNYKFSFWVHPTVSGNTYPKPDLEVRVNSNVILALPGVSLANGWTKYSANVSGISGTSLEIHQTNAGSLGYDYGIDDISFKRCVKSMIVILNPIDVICHGTATGSVKAVVTDGVPPYQYQWSNGEVTDEIANLVAGTYTVTVVDGIGCLEVISATVNSPAPLTPGPITGTYISACLPAVNSGGSYSIPAIPGVIYSWTVPSGMTIISGQGTNSIFATWNGTNVNAGIVGNVCVTVSNPCQTVTICQKVDINAVKPVTPPSISGPSKVCPGDVATYSIALVPRAASYIWTLPTGMTITSGAGTNVITVSVNASYTGGTISVIAVNACGSSPARTKPVLLNPPAVPGVITGPAGGQCGAVGVSYSIAPVPTATSYQWTVSNGTIVGSSTGTSISVNWSTSFTTGVVSVVAVNGCGVSAPRTLSVTGPPSIPGPITGATNVCTGGIYHYSVSSVVGALSYNWTTPGTILNGQGTKEVDIQFTSVPFTNQTISVKAINNCGTGATRILSGVNGNFCIRASNAIEGFNVYPNPARKQLYIEFMADCECRFSAELLDMTGRSVLQGNGIATERLNKTELKLDQIAEGVYFLRFTLNDVTNQVRIVIE